jgi:hypothetical protein
MTEKEVQLLGFECHYDDGDGHWDKFHYYTYKVTEGLEFITCASDETQNEQWWVEFMDTTPAVRFHNFAEMQALINLLHRHVITKEP